MHPPVQHPGDAALADPQQSELLEPAQRLAYGVPVDGEGGGQLALTGQRVARAGSRR